MAKKKLTEDELKWILSIDSTEAQQSVRKLDKENKQLASTNKDLKAKMTELVAAGKKDSQEYKNLSAEVEKNNTKLVLNKKKITELEKTLGLTSLTMAQLRKKAKELQYQLDHTAEATSPAEYKKLEKSLLAVKSRMNELRSNGQQTGDTLSGSISKATMAVKAFLALKFFAYLKDGVVTVYNVRKEFAKYEAVLRNTFQSSEKAAAVMTMLKQLASDTPYQLQELTEGYIKLVNRGIIPTREELIKMGDVASSQGKSLDQYIEAVLDAMTGEFERLKEFGIKASKENDKIKFSFKGVTSEVKFSEKAITDYLYSLGDLKGVQGSMAIQMEELEGRSSNLSDVLDGLANKIGARLEPTFKSLFSFLSKNAQKLSDVFTPLNESYQEQFDRVVSLETKLPSLISRYEELKAKTTLSKEEHEELNRTISSLANIVPGAITAFDEYGNAIAINTEKVHQFLEAEQNRLKYIHAETIQKAEDDIESAKQLKQKLEKELATGGRYKTDRKTGDMFLLPFTEEEINEKVQLIQECGAKIQGAEETIKRLSGETLREQVENQKQVIQKRAEFNNMTKEQLDAYIKANKDAADKYVEIAQEIYDHKFKEDKTPDDPKKTKSALELKLKEQENAHQAELTTLKNTQIQFGQTEQFYNLQRLSADTKFYQERLKLLQDYQKKSLDPKLQADISKEINAAQASLIETQQKRDQEMISVLKDNRDKRLKLESQSYKTQQIVFEKGLAEKQITQQQYDALMLSLDTTSSESRLKIYQDYQSDIISLELSSGTIKAQAVSTANEEVMTADLAAAQARAAQQKTLQNLVKDFKAEFKLTTVGEDTDLQLKVLEASYNARKEMAQEANMDTLELDQAFERARTNILQEAEDRRNQIRQQNGLLSMQEQHEIELDLLKDQREAGLLDEEEYQQAILDKRIAHLKAYYDYYSQLFSGAISALQEAELANIDAKYDAEIQRAGENSEEVARLEKEKENKKLAVQKKYANVNFAIKVSEIIANTAVSIMQAFAQLGPIAGAIAAAMLTATGAAQIATANAERKKVMAMTVEGAGGTGSGTGTRVAIGRESGGYVDIVRAQDGKRFDAVLDPNKRGFIDRPTVIVGEGPVGKSKEWVASNDALENPTVRPFINVLNEAQEKGVIRTVDMNQLMRQRLAGFESGGSISTSVPSSAPMKEILTPSTSIVGFDAINKLYDLLLKIDREGGLKAYIIYSEFQKMQNRLEESRKIGSKS
ncbi:hypothetical protein [Parabacteroides goldsteinii]|uniref:hypothetical protein n=1 Tax=Parabacteroides goldsteinii TaxID=328812 RepID=UPI0022E32F01|nr:hypothetical protein [Parabacteroides goldsteinii]